MRILLTGGAGYIGSHTALALLEAGHDVTVLDNFCNSSAESLRRVQELAGRSLDLVEGDVADPACLDRALPGCDAVIHFAGLKAVGESVAQPLRYYRNNITGTLALLEAMDRHGIRRLVFSSSATVYGEPERLPLDETCRTGGVTNPYGRTKLQLEEILADLYTSDQRWQIVILRYFNPVGAHPSGRIGEDPTGIPNNLMPFVGQVAVGIRPEVRIFGDDYPTPDGTGVRDYIHVVDLAAGHLAALDRFQSENGLEIFNLGTGRGYSVKEVIAAYGRAVGRSIPATVTARRPGDIAACWASPDKARTVLGWTARCDLETMVADAWRWQSANPQGYKS